MPPCSALICRAFSRPSSVDTCTRWHAVNASESQSVDTQPDWWTGSGVHLAFVPEIAFARHQHKVKIVFWSECVGSCCCVVTVSKAVIHDTFQNDHLPFKL